MEPRRGVPPAPQSQSASGGPPGAFATWQGAGEAPRHPAGSLGSLRSRQGAVSSPLRGAGRTNPLTRPALEKPPQARAGQDGAVGVDGGQGSRSISRSGPGLDAQERPTLRAGGWGCFSPSRLPRGERPGGPSETILHRAFGFQQPPSDSERGEAKRRGSNSPEGSYTLLLAASRAATGFRRKPVAPFAVSLGV